jgi:hypothetical protein
LGSIMDFWCRGKFATAKTPCESRADDRRRSRLSSNEKGRKARQDSWLIPSP